MPEETMRAPTTERVDHASRPGFFPAPKMAVEPSQAPSEPVGVPEALFKVMEEKAVPNSEFDFLKEDVLSPQSSALNRPGGDPSTVQDIAQDDSTQNSELGTPESQPLRVELSTPLLNYLFSDRYRASVDGIQAEFGLSDDDTIFIGDMDRLVMGGTLTLDDYVDALNDEFQSRFDDATRAKLLGKLLAERFVPLESEMTPTATDVANARNIALPTTTYYRVHTAPLSYSGAAAEIAAAAGLVFTDSSMRTRLRDLISSRAKGLRTDTQIRDTLMRPADGGGLGVDAVTADAIVFTMSDLMARTKIVADVQKSPQSSVLSPQAKETLDQGLRTQSPSSDDSEIEAIRARMPKPKEDATSALEKAVQATLARLSYRPADEYLARRLQNVVSSRLRDVRNAIDFRQLLMRDTKVGGLGVDTKTADAISNSVEESYSEFREGIAAEEKKKIEVQLEEQERKIKERRDRDAAEHARWFEEKIRSRKAGETARENVFRRVFAAGPTTPVQTSPIEERERRVERTKFGQLVPAERMAETVKPGIKVSEATAKLALSGATKPRMDGVTPPGHAVPPASSFSAERGPATPHLTGIVGELATLSLTEFRRLGANAEEAAQKIRNLVETLAQESFEKKVEGIRSFQNSPLQAAYMSLVGESFKSGKPVAATAEKKRAAGQDTLSPEEITAIIKLNSALHF